MNMEIDKNHLLEKQVELLYSRIEELYQRGLSHDEEFELIRQHWEDQMDDLRRSCEPKPNLSAQNVSPEYVESLQCKLADCLAKNAELNALVKSSEKVRAGVREELQRNLQKAMQKIEELSSNLSETEKKNFQLEEASKSHEADMQLLCEELQSAFIADLLKATLACKNLQDAVARFGEPISDENATVSGNAATSTSEDPLNELLEKIQKSTLEIAKHSEDFFELKQENEDLIRQYDIMTKNCEELDLYKESVARLKIELDKIKQHYELLGKNNENSIMTLKKDLQICKNEINEKNCAIKQLKDELNLSQHRYDELERKFGRFSKTREEGDVGDNEAQCDLKVSKCETRMNEGQLSPINKLGIPSDVTPPRQVFGSFTTSTPFPTHALGAGESAPLVVIGESQYQLALIRWMEACKDLNAENRLLKNQVSDLKMQMKELELSASGIRDEITVFDCKRKELELKLSDYAELKNKCCQLTEGLKMNELKMSGLEVELKHLQGLNKKLHDENREYEKKLNDTRITCDTTSKVPDDLLNDLNKKVHEVVLLKGEVETLSFTNHTLQARNDQLKELKNLYILKLEENAQELVNCRSEIEVLLLSSIEMSKVNKSYEKELRVLNSRLDHLNELRNQNWGLTEKNCLAEQMQKDILALCKEAIERKFEYDKLISNAKKSDHQVEELDARHRVELLIKDNNQLVHEKESLLITIADLQKMLHDFQVSIV